MAKLALLAVLAVVVTASARPDDPHHQPVHYKQPPKPYNFAYGVSDPYQGLDFGQDEVSDGSAVKGSYTVQLPDGRTQTVTYQADHDRGFHADVSYKGEAQYPPKSDYPPFVVAPQKGGYAPPAPTYH